MRAFAHFEIRSFVKKYVYYFSQFYTVHLDIITSYLSNR